MLRLKDSLSALLFLHYERGRASSRVYTLFFPFDCEFFNASDALVRSSRWFFESSGYPETPADRVTG